MSIEQHTQKYWVYLVLLIRQSTVIQTGSWLIGVRLLHPFVRELCNAFHYGICPRWNQIIISKHAISPSVNRQTIDLAVQAPEQASSLDGSGETLATWNVASFRCEAYDRRIIIFLVVLPLAARETRARFIVSLHIS